MKIIEINNLDLVARMRLNGWLVIPAEPGKKQTFCKWGEVTPANYNFSVLFKHARLDTNAAILLDGVATVVDLDAHTPPPNGASLFKRLDPTVYEGCIVEKTPSGGYHIYYKSGMAGREATIEHDGETIRVEILTGRRLCYCWPSTTNKGDYKVISRNNFLNTSPGMLPPLHPLWYSGDKKQSEPEPVQETPLWKFMGPPEEFSEEDRLAAVDYYKHRANYTASTRHDRARAMARCLAGWGEDRQSIIRFVEDYITSHGRELSDPREAERIADYALEHPIKTVPWRAINEARRERRYERLMRGVEP